MFYLMLNSGVLILKVVIFSFYFSWELLTLNEPRCILYLGFDFLTFFDYCLAIFEIWEINFWRWLLMPKQLHNIRPMVLALHTKLLTLQILTELWAPHALTGWSVWSLWRSATSVTLIYSYLLTYINFGCISCRSSFAINSWGGQMRNGMVECSVCHSKLVSPTTKTVSRAYDRYRSKVSSKHRALNVLLVVGDCILVGFQVISTFRSLVIIRSGFT